MQHLLMWVHVTCIDAISKGGDTKNNRVIGNSSRSKITCLAWSIRIDILVVNSLTVHFTWNRALMTYQDKEMKETHNMDDH